MESNLKFCFKELQKGNQDLFNHLFNFYYTNLCRFAYTYLKDEDASEEVVQELFISLWEQRNEMNIKGSLRAFLYTSVKNRSLNYIRNHNTRLLHHSGYANEMAQKVDYIINFCEKEELHDIINEVINELPDQCRLIFELSRNEGLSYKDIAVKLSVSPKTVENQIGIALKKLRSKLSPYLSSILAFL
jgi:RNA polymerase sigma-70 factor, ECF subfamily